MPPTRQNHYSAELLVDATTVEDTSAVILGPTTSHIVNLNAR
jgi:hypothetical protein